jgi:hypothetical protein
VWVATDPSLGGFLCGSPLSARRNPVYAGNSVQINLMMSIAPHAVGTHTHTLPASVSTTLQMRA